MLGKSVGVVLGVVFMIFVVLAGHAYHEMSKGSYTTKIVNNAGEKIGIVSMNETEAGVLMFIQVSGLNPKGEHAMHVHEKADCSPRDTFKNAGGHYNPMMKSHGMMHPEGHHAGDMPNLRPDEYGNIEAQILNLFVTLETDKEKIPEGRHPLFDEDGSALVIHADADDHMSQPSGAAGNRIACGEID